MFVFRLTNRIFGLLGILCIYVSNRKKEAKKIISRIVFINCLFIDMEHIAVSVIYHILYTYRRQSERANKRTKHEVICVSVETQD